MLDEYIGGEVAFIRHTDNTARVMILNKNHDKAIHIVYNEKLAITDIVENEIKIKIKEPNAKIIQFRQYKPEGNKQ